MRRSIRGWRSGWAGPAVRGGVLLLLGFAGAVGAAQSVWGPVAGEVIARLEQVAATYGAGDVEGARRAVIEAYFGVFESRKLEAAMRKQLGARHTYAVEQRFGQLRKDINAGVEVARVQAAVADLGAALRRDAATLDEAGVPAAVYEAQP